MAGKRSFPFRTIGTGLVAGAIGYAAVQIPGTRALEAGVGLIAFGVAVIGFAIAWWWPAKRGTSATIGRWSKRSRKHDGVASMWDHLRVSSSWAMRRKAHVLRPSLAELSRLQRYRVPVRQYAVALAKVGWHTVWSSCEDVTLRVGGPRMGKTQELACHVVDAPGPAVVTSTSTDIVEHTAPIRALRGPIHLFNPSGLGGWASTLKWSPLTGCQAVATAQRRAADMIPESEDPRGERWDDQARNVLSVFMHAAAVAYLPMRAVLGWVSDPAAATSGAEVDEHLGRSPEAAAMRLAAKQFFGLNLNTRTSITATAMPALRWLMDYNAATIGDSDTDDQFDVAELLAENGTVYLLGEEDGVVAPLVAALTAEIARQARMAAAKMPGGRLDPPLTIALDEAAVICRVPLHRWTSDSGKRGITLHISVQSRAQLIERWGTAAARIILNNCGAAIVFGGAINEDDLRAWSLLAGEHEVSVDTTDADGTVISRTTRKEPVLSPDRISNLPAGMAMVKRKGMPVALGRTPVAWKRRDIRSAMRRSPWSPITETAWSETFEVSAAEAE